MVSSGRQRRSSTSLENKTKGDHSPPMRRIAKEDANVADHLGKKLSIDTFCTEPEDILHHSINLFSKHPQ
jgi:hypothetical protein